MEAQQGKAFVCTSHPDSEWSRSPEIEKPATPGELTLGRNSLLWVSSSFFKQCHKEASWSPLDCPFGHLDSVNLCASHHSCSDLLDLPVYSLEEVEPVVGVPQTELGRSEAPGPKIP